MLVDFERVLLELEGIIAAKKSHGRNDLLVALAELKADYRIPEGLPEQAIRQYGNELSLLIHHGDGEPVAPTRPAEAAPASERPDGPDIDAGSLPASQRPKEDTCQTQPSSPSATSSSSSRSKSASGDAKSAPRPRPTERTVKVLS